MKYDKHHTDKIIESLAKGEGRVRACIHADIDYQTFLNWLKDESKIEFLEAVKKAEDSGNDKIKDLAKRAIIEKFTTQWQAGAWWLERNYPKDYSIKQNIDHTSKGESIKPLNITVETEEQKKEIEKLYKEE